MFNIYNSVFKHISLAHKVFMMAYSEYNEEILRDYFDLTVADVVCALLSKAERQLKRDQPTKTEM